jgi:DNA-binding transcriptional LysR family regulator
MLFTTEPVSDSAPEPEVETVAVDLPQPVSLGQIIPLPDPEVVDEPEAPIFAEIPASEPEIPAEPEMAGEKPITIASHPAILSRFQDKLAAAQEAFPDRPIAVDFARFTPDTVVPLLQAGTADIALFYALGEVRGLPSDYLWSERWSLFARADHPLAQMAEVRFADCADMLVVLFDEGNPLRALCEACLTRAKLWPTPTVLETDDFSAIAAELDYGEAVFPAFGVTAAQFAARPGLKRLALIEEMPGVEVRRAVSPYGQEDPTIAALAGLLG